ncbi:hypothetical protein A3715_17485 [Oleiphilus sp. HI0009]|nr:hypothetical protein A3715_17485 [Oleiphilus sp. HI0009]
MHTVRSVTEDILGPNGIAYSSGLHDFREKQYHYALNVADNIERGRLANPSKVIEETSVAMIEAATGIGKTIGYLVPLFAYSAIYQKRVAVSTYTRSLQTQLMDKDIPLAIDWVKQVTSVILSYAPRYGINAFVSFSKADTYIHSLLSEKKSVSSQDRDRLLHFLNWSETCSDPSFSDFDSSIHTGKIADYLSLSEISELPFGIDKKVSLSQSDPDQEKLLYEKHCLQSKGSDVLVITHAMALLNNLRHHKILDADRTINSMVFDEAEHLEAVAASIYSQDIPVHKTHLTLKAANNVIPLFDYAIDQIQLLTEFLRSSEDQNISYLNLNKAYSRELFSKVSSLIDTLSGPIKVIDSKIKQSTLSLDHRNILEEVQYLFYGISKFQESLANVFSLSSSNTTPSISFSPVKRYPSLQVIPEKPAQLIGRLWSGYQQDSDTKDNFVSSCCFTSATLGTLSVDFEFDYLDFARSIGIFQDSQGGLLNKRLILQKDLSKSYEPEQFGKMFFVLPDPLAPSPLIVSSQSEVKSNIDWLKYTSKMFNYAFTHPSKKLSYNRTLGLCASYNDAEDIADQLSKLIPESKLIVHTRKGSLQHALSRFIEDPESIFLTPTSWEGLNLPSSIANIVIPRLPIPHPDSLESRTRARNYYAKGYSSEQIKKIDYSINMRKTKKKLKQGFGRGIRCHTDHVRIFISDPRFPLPSSKQYSALDYIDYEIPIEYKIRYTAPYHFSIPTRFLVAGGPYERAKIFMIDGSINELKKTERLFS